MKYTLKVYSIWEIGQRKDSLGNPHQEDNMFPAFGQEASSDRLFILCDGMGGHEAGEIASAAVCEAMSNSLNGIDGAFTDQDLQNALNDAYDALDAHDNGAAKKMGTTMTFLKLHDAGATIAHIGDSRVYHIRPGKTDKDTEILHETQDHSLVNDLIRMGEMTREEARFSSQKNVITRAMQPMMDRRPKADIYHTSDIRAGDYFYLCSDGMLEQPEMENGTVLKRIFSSLVDSDEKRRDILIGATAENRDNHTAFIVHILDVADDTVVEMSKPSLKEMSNPSLKEMSKKNSDLLDTILRLTKIVGVTLIFAAVLFFVYRWFKPSISTKTEPKVVISNDKPLPNDDTPTNNSGSEKSCNIDSTIKSTVDTSSLNEVNKSSCGTIVDSLATNQADSVNTEDKPDSLSN